VTTLIVVASGTDSVWKVASLALEHRGSSFRIIWKSWKKLQFSDKITARFHDLTAHEIAKLKVQLSFIEGVRKVDLI
jgi:hypothetical protein